MNSFVQTDKTTICLSCRLPNTSGARFCNHCGATLPAANSGDVDTIAPTPEVTAQILPNDPLIGRTIEGKYRIDSVVGAGGMGAVYLATRLLIGDEVAIKILHKERVAEAHAGERFRREAQAAARLKHPNAVSIYDFGVSSDGLQYLVMELVEGRSLREIIKQQGPLSPSLVAETASQVCAALDEAHRQHIVHRDVKPDNIILNSIASGLRVKVLDFGIAKLRDDTASHLTQTGNVMGTPHYMSPEQCLGEELDSRADIYSVGIILYEMLCGRVPFNSPISTAVVVQHVNQPPPPLRTINPNVSPQVEAVVLHALEKRRDARPQTAGALAREFTAAVRGSSADFSKHYPGALTQSSGYQSLDDETTVERQGEAATLASPKSSQELAPTLHLASLSGATGPVAGGRATAGSGAVAVSTSKPNVALKVGIVAAMLVVLGAIGLTVTWRLTRSESSNRNSSANSSQSNKSNTAADDAISDKKKSDSAAPPGMTYVPGGRFIMGSNDQDQDSKPPHSATVRPFFIDIYEVTCEEYKKFIEATGRPAPKTWINGGYLPARARQPVTDVSWEDADAYAHWAGKRLPTEDEWEFAARGPKGLMYPWGKAWKPGCANADKEGQGRKGMADVGTHNCGSPFGAMDMIGNAWEWTTSDWAPYPNGHLRDPGKGGEKVIRGGSWESPKDVTTTFRVGLAAAGEQTGFRCAKDAP